MEITYEYVLCQWRSAQREGGVQNIRKWSKHHLVFSQTCRMRFRINSSRCHVFILKNFLFICGLGKLKWIKNLKENTRCGRAEIRLPVSVIIMSFRSDGNLDGQRTQTASGHKLSPSLSEWPSVHVSVHAGRPNYIPWLKLSSGPTIHQQGRETEQVMDERNTGAKKKSLVHIFHKNVQQLQSDFFLWLVLNLAPNWINPSEKLRSLSLHVETH